MEFEHRSLHSSNVLVAQCPDPDLVYILDGQRFSVESHGVKVAIIDFNTSRMIKGNLNRGYLCQGEAFEDHFYSSGMIVK